MRSKYTVTLDETADARLSDLMADYGGDGSRRGRGPHGPRDSSRSRVVCDAISLYWRYRIGGESFINPHDPRFH